MGESLLPLVDSNGGMAPDRVAISELFSVGAQMRSLRTRAWKFTDLPGMQRRFFVDLRSDPRELKLRTDFDSPLGRSILARYEAAEKMLDTWRAQVAAGATSDIPDDVLNQLRSFGYVGGPTP